ncbi:MAG TPA: hypothetical protein VM187_09070 [Niastella sp.]|nr:hypothetical protein [Niastella sp.]
MAQEQPLQATDTKNNPGTNDTNARLREQNANAEQHQPSDASATFDRESNDEIATNDGAIIETLDTAFHNKPGVAEGSNISGSNRADYYESRSYGKTDAEEELDALNNGQTP